MDKLDSSCPMVGPAPVEKERSDRHSQGSIYIIISWIKKVEKGANPFIVRLLNPLPWGGGLTKPFKASVPIFSLQDLLRWKQQQLW